MGDTRRTRHGSAKQCELSELIWALWMKKQSLDLHGSTLGPLSIFICSYIVINLVYLWDSWLLKWAGLWDVCLCWDSCPHFGLPHPTLIWQLLFHLIIFYFLMFSCYLRNLLFSQLRQKRSECIWRRGEVSRIWDK